MTGKLDMTVAYRGVTQECAKARPPVYAPLLHDAEITRQIKALIHARAYIADEKEAAHATSTAWHALHNRFIYFLNLPENQHLIEGSSASAVAKTYARTIEHYVKENFHYIPEPKPQASSGKDKLHTDATRILTKLGISPDGKSGLSLN